MDYFGVWDDDAANAVKLSIKENLKKGEERNKRMKKLFSAQIQFL